LLKAVPVRLTGAGRGHCSGFVALRCRPRTRSSSLTAIPLMCSWHGAIVPGTVRNMNAGVPSRISCRMTMSPSWGPGAAAITFS
jgi:hypothetical protein